jgi:hypothetical protein
MDRRELLAERDYLTDKLTEIGSDLKRLITEGDALKAELLAESDAKRRQEIRRRRTYIRRRSEELKAERQTSVGERYKIVEELKSNSPVS